MSKLYMLNRMTGSPAAGGGILSGILNIGKKIFGGGKKAVAAAGSYLSQPGVQSSIADVGADLLGLTPKSGRGGGGFGGGRRRRRGISATELRGYRKVAGLIHKEGMVSKRARGRH